MTTSSFTAVPASRFNVEQLTGIYNESRSEYIIPMPMNAHRMAEYIRQYDVDLHASVIAFNAEQQAAGLGMLGLRDRRAWITRLGVIPTRRGRGVGQFIMEALITRAIDRGCQQIQLEVIEGNQPAYALFTKLGFVETRRLHILRRPPASPDPLAHPFSVEPLPHEAILHRLNHRADHPSWLDETSSILAGDSVEGLLVSTADAHGWIVLHAAPDQLTHFVIGAEPGSRLTSTLVTAILTAVHQRHPLCQARIENVPVDSPFLPAYQTLGYTVEFSRIEMLRLINRIEHPSSLS